LKARQTSLLRFLEKQKIDKRTGWKEATIMMKLFSVKIPEKNLPFKY
jgi:hypothetical protein